MEDFSRYPKLVQVFEIFNHLKVFSFTPEDEETEAQRGKIICSREWGNSSLVRSIGPNPSLNPGTR